VIFFCFFDHSKGAPIIFVVFPLRLQLHWPQLLPHHKLVIDGEQRLHRGDELQFLYQHLLIQINYQLDDNLQVQLHE